LRPLLSVIIPTYKRLDSLAILLEKLNLQTVIDQIEILIIDQNEKDFIHQEILNISRNIRQVYQDKPNVSLARNNGYKEAKAEYLLFIDDDLEPEQDFCQKGISFFEKNEEVECFCPLVYNDNGKEIEMEKMKQNIVSKYKHFYKINNTISAALFIKSETYIKSGGFDPYLFDYVKSTEDNEFFIRLKKHNVNIYYDSNIDIFHSEEIIGGCSLREDDYWNNRKKFIKGWAFRYRVHNGNNLKLNLMNIVALCRSSFLNSELFKRNPLDTIKLIKNLINGLVDSGLYLKDLKDYYKNGWRTNHLKQYHEDSLCR